MAGHIPLSKKGDQPQLNLHFSREGGEQLAVEVMGVYAAPKQPRLVKHGSLHELIGEPTANAAVSVSQYFADRAVTIASGSTEVQENIIASRMLGL